MTALFGLKSTSQPSRQILPQHREREPSSTNESLFSSSGGFCPWVRAHRAAARHLHAEKGLGSQLESSLPELTDTIWEGARVEGDGFLPTVGFTSHREDGGVVGWKCKGKKKKQTTKKTLLTTRVRVFCSVKGTFLPPPIPPSSSSSSPPSPPSPSFSPSPPSPAHSSWFIFGCKFMAPFVFLILLQTILKPQTFLLGANKLNTCMPPRQNINCGVLMNDVVLDSETKQTVSLHHCLLPPRVSRSRMSTQPTDCFYFTLSFLFLSQLRLFWDYYVGTEHGPGKSSALLPRLDASKESLSPTIPVHRSTPAPAARILHRETPSWPRALLSLDLKPKGRPSWPFPVPISFSTELLGSLAGRGTGVPPSLFAELHLPAGLRSF